jgi:hypothetical protein
MIDGQRAGDRVIAGEQQHADAIARPRLDHRLRQRDRRAEAIRRAVAGPHRLRDVDQQQDVEARTHRLARRRDPLDRRAFASIVAVGLTTAFAGVLWPLVAWGVTGSMTAYTDTELVWRRAYIGEQELLPFTPWFQGAEWWLNYAWHIPPEWAWPLGIAGVVLLVGGFAVFLMSRPVRRLGVDLRFWMLSYALYLLAVFFPQSSTFRLLVPLAPGLGALALPESRVYRVALVVAGIAGQIGWLYIAWWVDGQDFTPP